MTRLSVRQTLQLSKCEDGSVQCFLSKLGSSVLVAGAIELIHATEDLEGFLHLSFMFAL
jgi:hypothetical protein